MRLITAHRILIVTGIVFFLLYAGLQARAWTRTGERGALAQALGSPVVAAGLYVYYRSLARTWGRR